MRPRTPAAWLGRRLARTLLKGALDFDEKAFNEHVDRLGEELTR